jgi:hypothetical protein
MAYNNLPRNIVNFSANGGEKDLFVLFQDYYKNYRAVKGDKVAYDKTLDFSEKEAAVNKLLHAEIARLSGVQKNSNMSFELFASNPNVRWASFAIVSILIDAVLPSALIDSIGAYTDIRAIDYGDSATFEIKPRDLFYVSKTGRSMKRGEVQRMFTGKVTIPTEMRQVSVDVALYRVLSGAESLAEYASKAIRSIETQVTLDAYSAFATAMAALPATAGNSQLKVSGWSQDDFVRLAEKVGSWGGAKPVLMGTQRALQNVLPDDANYRYELSSEYAALGYVQTAFGYDTMALRQVADYRTEFAQSIADDKLWIIAPGNDKLVKLVLEGSTMSNVSGMFDNADLTQNADIYKMWGAGIATNAMAATIDLA